MRKEDVVVTVCVIVLFLHCDVNKCDLYKVVFYLFLSLSERAKITDSFGLNGNDKVCQEVCYRIITILPTRSALHFS